MTDFDVVTGAFSYSGAAIVSELQAAGRQVRTLTGHPRPRARGQRHRGQAAAAGHLVRRQRSLINNIAWLLRHLPVFAVGGTGEYRIRPIHVEDLARLCVRAADGTGTEVIDAVGPERPAFGDLVRFIRDAVGSRRQVIRVPGSLIPPTARLLGLALRDTLLTAEEFEAMAEGLADTDGPATGETSLTQWITDHKGTLGRTYSNELTRHFR